MILQVDREVSYQIVHVLKQISAIVLKTCPGNSFPLELFI